MALAIQLEVALWVSASVDGARDIGVIATCFRMIKSGSNVHMFIALRKSEYFSHESQSRKMIIVYISI